MQPVTEDTDQLSPRASRRLKAAGLLLDCFEENDVQHLFGSVFYAEWLPSKILALRLSFGHGTMDAARRVLLKIKDWWLRSHSAWDIRLLSAVDVQGFLRHQQSKGPTVAASMLTALRFLEQQFELPLHTHTALVAPFELKSPSTFQSSAMS